MLVSFPPICAAKHYSVTPLGAHSGLIRWVDGMTPIFTLYRKWQQRQAANPKKDKPGTAPTTKNTSPQAILRPSELFYQKLTPLLARRNIKAAPANRKEWPLDVLKEVLDTLTGNENLARFWLFAGQSAVFIQFRHSIYAFDVCFCFAAESPQDLLAKELWFVYETQHLLDLARLHVHMLDLSLRNGPWSVSKEDILR